MPAVIFAKHYTRRNAPAYGLEASMLNTAISEGIGPSPKCRLSGGGVAVASREPMPARLSLAVTACFPIKSGIT